MTPSSWRRCDGLPRRTPSFEARPAGALLWNYRQDSYAGRPIKRLDVAILDASTPTPTMPGVPSWSGAT
ncbi:hypothetical protein [Nonomuraea sp. NPDC048916]|uniref:hypothetical protein n=1 Tax=Nonomuraea sp. NPDC048916 TaxID=3154232 RepID=UPI00340582DD